MESVESAGTSVGNDTTRWRPRAVAMRARGVQSVAGSGPFFDAGDDGRRGAHALSEFALAEATLNAQVVDELAEGEVSLDLVASGSARPAPLSERRGRQCRVAAAHRAPSRRSAARSARHETERS